MPTEPIIVIFITLSLLLGGCKPTPRGQTTTTGAPPITVQDSVIGYGFRFRSTLNVDTYRVTPEDCGYVLRFNRDAGVKVTLPLLPFPCALMMFNEKDGLVNVQLEGTAADGSGGDFNGEKTFDLANQEGAILHVHQNSAFWRGLYTCRGGYGRCAGGGAPPVPSGGTVASYSDLSDFKAGTPSNKRLEIAAGSAAIGSYSFPAQISGTIDFTSGSGDAKVYVSKLGILTTEATVGTTATMSGGMVLITASTPSFPPGSIPICDLALDSGTYTVDACGLASRVRGYAIDAGPGINITYTQGIPRISTDATVARTDAPGATTAGATVSKVVPWIALILALIAICLAIYLKKAAAPLGDYDNPPHV